MGLPAITSTGVWNKAVVLSATISSVEMQKIKKACA